MRTIVLVTPPDSVLHPNKHYEQLYKILKRNGYEVYPFSLANLVKYNCRAIWHIHWIDIFHSGLLRRTRMQKHYLVISGFRFLNFLAALTLCKFQRAKIIWTVHNLASHDRRCGFFENWVTRLLLRFSDTVTALNEHIRQALAGRYHFHGAGLMRQGLYLDCYSDTVTREEARGRLGLGEREFVLLFFGGISEYKGIDIAIEALGLLADDSIKLLIVGKLDRASSYGDFILESAAKNSNVRVVDQYVPDHEVQNYFRAADFTIYPYRRIDNSGTLYLTLAFGIPTIMRGAGGVPEVACLNPKVAILLDQADKFETARAIQAARKRSIAGSEFDVFREKLSWEHLEPEIVSSFDKLQNRL
jgi:beta-1,4-mannosyltransferase